MNILINKEKNSLFGFIRLRRKGDIMLKFSSIIVLVTLVVVIPGISIADIPELVIWEGSGTYEIGSGKEWFQLLELRTYDNVTVVMPGGGGVNEFKMYDDSSLTMYDGGSINYLYLYDNTTASFFGCSYMNELYINPANTGWVKLYADFDRFEPLSPYGEGHIYGNWLSDGNPFNIHLVGHGAYSHIQIIPEPATLVMLGLGGLAILKKRRR